MKYIAFLRGINVGGNKKVPMEKLRNVLESHGYTNIRTLLNSGNVVFEAASADEATLEKLLADAFGFSIPIIVRTEKQIQALIDADPFKGIEATKSKQLYVTFVKGSPEKTAIQPSEFFTITDYSGPEVCTILHPTESYKTPDLMGALEKQLDKNITTRNWNTVVKIAQLLT